MCRPTQTGTRNTPGAFELYCIFQYKSRVIFWQTKEELRAISTTLPQHPSEVACLALFVLLTNRIFCTRLQKWEADACTCVFLYLHSHERVK